MHSEICCRKYRYLWSSLANGSEYTGQFGFNTKELFEWLLPKFQQIVMTRPPIIACETILCLSEVQPLLKCWNRREEEVCQLPMWISIACNSPTTLNSGESIEDYCRIIEDQLETTAMMSRRNKYLLAGVNCTHPDYIEEILYLFQDYLSKDRYQVVYPNRGDVWDHL